LKLLKQPSPFSSIDAKILEMGEWIVVYLLADETDDIFEMRNASLLLHYAR